MLEWNITEDNTPLPSDAPDPTPRRPINRSVVIGVFVLLVGITIGVVAVFWWRARVVEEQMRTDLLLFIRREEQARRFGLQEQAEQFMAEGVPEPWQARYEDSFSPPPSEAISVTISIAELELQGDDALVQVQMGRQVQERRYRQTEQGWRRVPLGATERGESITFSQGDVVFQYHTADTDFATDLIAAYPDLIELWSAWGGMLPKIPRVRIEPGEFTRPAYMVESTLNVSTPSIASLPTHWDLTGEEAVRFWMAQEIGARITLNRINLPGDDRFIKALVTVTALRWAGIEEPYTHLTNRWRDIAATESGSSFYNSPHQSQQIDPFAPTPPEAAALLTADLLYTQGGNAQIAQTVQAMSGVRQWDAVFEEVAGLNTLEFETLGRGGPVPTTILDAPLIQGEPLPNTFGQAFQLQIEGHDQPIWVQTHEKTQVFLPNGAEVDRACARTFADIEIEGEWYESGLRLMAERITVAGWQSTKPATARPVPADTLYYISRFQDVGGISTIHLLAVSPDGSQTMVWSHPNITFDPMTRSATQFMMPLGGITAVQNNVRDCNLQWILHFSPLDGTVSTWMSNTTPPMAASSYFWDESRGIGMVVAVTFSEDTGSRSPFWILRLDGSEPYLEMKGHMLPGIPQAIRPGHDEILIYDYNANRIILQEWWSDRITWELPSTDDYFFSNAVFDDTGRYLYLNRIKQQDDFQDFLSITSGITRYDLETGEEIVIWNEDMGGVQMMGIDANGERLYVIALMHGSGELAIFQYEDGVWSPLIAANPEDQRYNYLKVCSNGGALFVRMGNPLTEGQIPQQYDLFFITPEGTLDPNPIPFELSDFPIAC
jgi:hypothetical protein